MTVQAAVQIPAAVTLVTTAETIVATLPFVGQGTARDGNLISGFINVTQGTAGTAITIRVRAGATVTGTLIGVADVNTLAAAAIANIEFGALDLATFPAGNQYVVTAQATAATGNGTVNDCVMSLDVISPAA
jgi:hypothetical protein